MRLLLPAVDAVFVRSDAVVEGGRKENAIVGMVEQPIEVQRRLPNGGNMCVVVWVL